MQEAADNLEFELAADIRDRIRELREEFDLDGGDDSDGVPAPGPESTSRITAPPILGTDSYPDAKWTYLEERCRRRTMLEYSTIGRGARRWTRCQAGLGFFGAAITHLVSTAQAFVFSGVLPLVLGGAVRVRCRLAVGEFEHAFVRTVTLWCLAGTGAMFVLVLVTLIGNGSMGPLSTAGSRSYLSNFLMGAVSAAHHGVTPGGRTAATRSRQQAAGWTWSTASFEIGS